MKNSQAFKKPKPARGKATTSKKPVGRDKARQVDEDGEGDSTDTESSNRVTEAREQVRAVRHDNSRQAELNIDSVRSRGTERTGVVRHPAD